MNLLRDCACSRPKCRACMLCIHTLVEFFFSVMSISYMLRPCSSAHMRHLALTWFRSGCAARAAPATSP